MKKPLSLSRDGGNLEVLSVMLPRVLRAGVFQAGISVSIAVLCLSPAVSAQSSRPDFRNRLAPYVSSPQRAIDKMLEMADLKPGETLYDLGCGDGRILIAAAERYHVKGVGIEISDRLARTAEDNVKAVGLKNEVEIVRGDMMSTDLSRADVVTLYLITTANESLRPNLEKFLKKDARLVSYDYPIPGWKPVDEEKTDASRYGNRHTIYLYRVPASFKK
jgi:SAM-dependent methyltransferase